jgi:hypothetical protein
MAEFRLLQDIFYTAYTQLVPTQLWKTLLQVARPSDP